MRSKLRFLWLLAPVVLLDLACQELAISRQERLEGATQPSPMSLSGIPTLTESCRFLSDPKLDGRSPGSAGHRTANAYLRDLMPRLGFKPLFGDSYGQKVMSGGRAAGENLGGIQPGRSGRSILLGAHYDHLKGIPGADDNAAAVSILIDTARQLGQWNGEHDLVLCFFDLEEPPHFHGPTMGSSYFAAHPPLDLGKLDCALILDLCGHDVPIPGAEDAMFVMGAEFSGDLVRAVEAVRNPPLPVFMFQNARVGDMSDHHAFRLQDRPFLFFSCGRWEHYHRPSDRFENLNLGKMQRFADYLRLLVQQLDGATVTVSPVADFWKVEARSVERLLRRPAPASSRELDTLLSALMRQFSL